MMEEKTQFPTSADGYDVYGEIGAGAFAKVYRAITKDTHEQVAIKVLDLDQFNTNWEEIRREIQVMSLLHHPNVVKILTSFVDGQDLWIVMPFMEAGSCAAIMKSLELKTGFKNEELLATILKETLQGLEYFHKDGRIHRDVKAGNILVGAHGEVQLADFGVAGTLMENGERKNNVRTFTGTPCWMAPEVMENSANGYDEKADIWSFGITAMELAYGRAPYALLQPMKVMLLTLQEDPPTCDIYKDESYKFSKHFHSMIEKCLRRDPKARPSAKKLLEHKFFKQAKDANYLVETIVKKLSSKPLGNKQDIRRSTKPDNSRKPVTVGAWVFDDDQQHEFDQAKQIAQEKLEREKQLSKSYLSGDSDEENENPAPPVTHSSSSSSSFSMSAQKSANPSNGVASAYAAAANATPSPSISSSSSPNIIQTPGFGSSQLHIVGEHGQIETLMPELHLQSSQDEAPKSNEKHEGSSRFVITDEEHPAASVAPIEEEQEGEQVGRFQFTDE